MKLLLLLSAAAALPAFAANPPVVHLFDEARAEDKLRRFVESDQRLKTRLELTARREESYVSDMRDGNVRDALANRPNGDKLLTELETVTDDKRRDLLKHLPGMKTPPTPSSFCHTVADCPNPDLALDVADARALPESLRRLVRPWMVLQLARGSDADVSTLDGPGDATVSVRLHDSKIEPLIVNVTPNLLGGFKVWFERPLVLAALYDREREAVLRPAR